MTNEELIQKFNPATAGGLTEADVATMRGLTTDQIGVLAKAYPNQGHLRPYLLLHDSAVPDNKQLYPLSSWQNLYNLHKYHSRKNFTAFTFKALLTAPKKTPALRGLRPAVATAGKVVDLSSAEAAQLLRQNFGDTATNGTAAATSETVPTAKKVPPRSAAKASPKAAAKIVDVANKTVAGKVSKAAPVKEQALDDEELQDFSAAD